MYDIALIGLGPAGATVARLLSKDFKVIALDKAGKTKMGFTKPCGGLLAPQAQKIIAELGLTLPKKVLVNPQIFSVKTLDLNCNITRHYQRCYLNLDRFLFDDWLRSLIDTNTVEVKLNAQCKNIERIESGFKVSYSLDNSKEQSDFIAKKIIGADGANSIVRRLLFPDFKLRTRLSVQEWFKDTHKSPQYVCVFDKDTTDTYAWGLTKDDYFIFGGAFMHHAKDSLEELKAKLEPHGFNLKAPIKTEACLLVYPQNKYCLGDNGAFLIGEAAGFVSPSSFEGISYALDSARILATILTEHITDCKIDEINKADKTEKTNKTNKVNLQKIYKRKTKKIRHSLFVRAAKAKILYSPFWRKLILKSKIQSLKID